MSSHSVLVCSCSFRSIDGTEFDSSFKRGQPSTFKPNQCAHSRLRRAPSFLTSLRVIGGWTEALQLMPAGSKWELTIPNALAYGDEAKGAHIYRGAVLVFELELIEVK